MSIIEAKLEQLGLPLPVAPPPVGAYVPVIRMGNLVVTSGQLPFVGKQIAFEGKLGANLHEQDGWNAARICTVNALAQIKACVGSLSMIKQIVRVRATCIRPPIFAVRRRSSTAHPSCSSKSSATPAGTRASPWESPKCPSTRPYNFACGSKSRKCTRVSLKPERRSLRDDDSKKVSILKQRADHCGL